MSGAWCPELRIDRGYWGSGECWVKAQCSECGLLLEKLMVLSLSKVEGWRVHVDPAFCLPACPVCLASQGLWQKDIRVQSARLSLEDLGVHTHL